MGFAALSLSAVGARADDAASSSTGATTAQDGFVHPGLLHTEADFTRMAAKVTAGESPWVNGWKVLTDNPYASLGYKPNPRAAVYRGKDGVHAENYSLLYKDIAAAYAHAVRWKVTGDTAYAEKSIQIMNDWSAVLTVIGGDTNAALAAGIYGYEFANAAEIMRSYSGWAAADFARFQTMMVNVFYPINHDFINRHNNTQVTHYWANWDLCNMASIMAIGVLCDNQAYFDEAINYFKTGAGNGCIMQAVYYVHPGYLGQWQETGRDQGHNTLGIALVGAICEMAWNQGIDLYGYDNNRVLAGAEYVAKGNLIESGTTYYTVPYLFYTNVDKVNQSVFSTGSQGTARPCWALLYNHYVNRQGLDAPYTGKFMDFMYKTAPEGGGGNYGPNSGGYDQLGYGTLTCTRDPIASGSPPSGLTARLNAGDIVLSWWGTAYATGYTVKRATQSGGPYTTLKTGIADLLTYTDTGPTDGVYYYVITAETPSGESAASNEATASTTKTLQTQFTFDEGTGTTAGDGGTLVNATWATGKTGTAVSLNSSNSAYVSLPENIMLSSADFTIAAWVFWNGNQTWARIFDFGTGTGRYMFLSPRGGSGKARFAITLNSGNGEQVIDANIAVPSGRWAHVAVTLSGHTGTLYIDGTEVGTNTAMYFAPFHIGPTKQNWIGRSQYSADPYFNGLIDDFRIYNGALDSSGITALMA